ncbi:MAG: hypothetical protein ACKVX7_15670 [Planctomycetota bacterium]
MDFKPFAWAGAASRYADAEFARTREDSKAHWCQQCRELAPRREGARGVKVASDTFDAQDADIYC